MKKHVFTNKLVSSIEPAAPVSVWGKGVPGKGGRTTNSTITEKKTDKEEN